MPKLLPRLMPGRGAHPLTDIADFSQEAYDHCLHAALYIATHSEGVRQRDATRFLCLTFFGALEAENIRASYREAILETSAAATDEMARLDSIMREELGRINPLFPKLVADQEPVDEQGCQRATRAILSRFTGAPSQPAQQPRWRYGCSIVVIILVLMLVILIVVPS